MARKFFTPIDLTGLELTNFKIHNLASDPTPKGEGHAYFNTVDHEIRVYNGSNWMPVGGSVLFGNTASRPAASNDGRLYVDTQKGVLYFDNGASWDQVGIGANTTDTLTNKTLTSPSVSGLYLSDSSIVFEGATDNAFETTLTVEDSTADRTLTLPDATDTLVGRATTDTLTNKTISDALTFDDGATSGTIQAGMGTLTVYADGQLFLNAGGDVILSPTTKAYVGSAEDPNDEIATIGGTQDISNKRIVDTLYFTDGVTVNDEGQIAILSPDHQFEIKANYGDLDLKTVAAGADVNVTAGSGSIILNPTGDVYKTASDSADNILVTRGDTVTLSNKTLGSSTSLGADLDADDNKVVNLADPTNPQDAANKRYVDAAVVGIDWKPSVRVATTAAITLATGLENGDTLDGVTLVTGDRVLVKNQTAATENGLYVVQASGAPVRSSDADTAAEITASFAVFVEEGTANTDSGWVLTNNGTVTVGTTELVFTQFTGLGQITAGNGLTKTANTLDVVAGLGIVSNANDVAIDTAVVVRKYATDLTYASGTPTSFTVTHDLGTRDVTVAVYDTSTYEEVITDVVRTSTSVVTILFAESPASGAFRVVVHA